jgi:transcriptional regulator with XRE-family HTH domain
MSAEMISALVRNARQARGWSQNELGRRVGMSGKNIWKIENGGQTTTVTLDKIAEALGVRLEVAFVADTSEEFEDLQQAARQVPPEHAALGARLLRVLPRLPVKVRDVLLSWIAIYEGE